MKGIYTLESVKGLQVVPVGGLYSFVHLEVGKRALIHQHSEEGRYTTSAVKEIVVVENKIIVTTRNSIYTFKEVVE